jgi:hypothetical protein
MFQPNPANSTIKLGFDDQIAEMNLIDTSPGHRPLSRWRWRVSNAADRRKPDQAYGARWRRVMIEAISTQDLHRTGLTACQPCVVYPHFACGTDLPFAAILIRDPDSTVREANVDQDSSINLRLSPL